MAEPKAMPKKPEERAHPPQLSYSQVYDEHGDPRPEYAAEIARMRSKDRRET